MWTAADLGAVSFLRVSESHTLVVRAPALILELPYRERQGTQRGSAQQPPAHAKYTPKWPSHSDC